MTEVMQWPRHKPFLSATHVNKGPSTAIPSLHRVLHTPSMRTAMNCIRNRYFPVTTNRSTALHTLGHLTSVSGIQTTTYQGFSQPAPAALMVTVCVAQLYSTANRTWKNRHKKRVYRKKQQQSQAVRFVTMENSCFSYSVIFIITLLVLTTMALEECLLEQLRLKAQVRHLEHQTKLQQIKIENLLQEKELQFMDRGDEMVVINLGEKRTYADCGEIYNDGHKRSGFYKIQPRMSNTSFSVFCDMTEGGGWTVVQRRSDGSQDFNRNWTDYKQGFGDFTTAMGEYWLGNDKLHYLTLQDDYTLRIDLLDFEGQRRYADYKSFRVNDEESAYQISCGDYSGTAGDSLTGGFNPEVQWWANHNGMKFSTWDRDNDNYEENCAVDDKGGWWYNRCHSTNLNGLYYKGPYTSNTDDGIVWYTWHGWWYSMKYVAMKIRSANFEPNLV